VDFDAFLRIVGSNMRKARWKAGLTQESAAESALTFRLLARLERGQGNPTLRTLFLLASKYGLSVRDVVETGKEAPLDVPLTRAVIEKPQKRRPSQRVESPKPRKKRAPKK
jgi:transcriptional regulator with XRE-family HTH domain